jgi:hypothetical protein
MAQAGKNEVTLRFWNFLANQRSSPEELTSLAMGRSFANFLMPLFSATITGMNTTIQSLISGSHDWT